MSKYVVTMRWYVETNDNFEKELTEISIEEKKKKKLLNWLDINLMEKSVAIYVQLEIANHLLCLIGKIFMIKNLSISQQKI